jgi:hypothetical protein
MSLCISDCAIPTPLSFDECNVQTRVGGIPRLIFFACDWRFDGTVKIDGEDVEVGPITDIAAWQLGVANRKISRTPIGYGEKPETSTTTERIAACLPEAIATETHVLNFISKAFDNDNSLDCVYFNQIRLEYLQYRIGWVDCTGRVYVGNPASPGFAFVPTSWAHIIPDNNDELQFYQANSEFKFQGIVCPIVVPNFDQAFNVPVIS